MKRNLVYSLMVFSLLGVFIWAFWDSEKKRDDFSERARVSLRDVGNQLLLSNNDSTSLVLPVKEIEPSKYEVMFEKSLSFDPNGLVSITTNSFQKSQLPSSYTIEVIQCSDGEVAYSYKMTSQEATTIIPCGGRVLPENCYQLQVWFEQETPSQKVDKRKVFYITVFIIMLLFIVLEFFYYKKEESPSISDRKPAYAAIGSFKFYPTQNKLIKEAEEINLSKKECELLALFVAQPNQVITRDELTKKVWEDNGVIVGRSLDTYISKLRKKLQGDDRIKLTNVHGVGYKLEVNI